jgi:hypothetical protein
MLRRLAADAMRSDPKALKLWLSLVQRYAESPEAEPHSDDLLASDQEILARFVEERIRTTDVKRRKTRRSKT